MPRKQVVLITGCSNGGIGYYLAKEFANRGCHVYASARKIESMADLDACGCKLLQLDVTNSQHIQQAMEAILSEQQRIDVLVNNAGLLAKAPIIDASMSHFRSVMDVNFFGVVELVNAVAPHMVKQRSGTIINIGSIAGYTSQPFWSAYSPSKSAVMSFTDALRNELKPFGVRVVYCAPGYIATQLDTKSQASGLNLINPNGHYAASQQITDFVHKTEGIDQGTPPAVFSKGFVNMAFSHKPPAHYVSGKLARLVWSLGYFAPYRMMDNHYCKATGLANLMVSG
eukprot:GHRR01004971.1.p1 GENE.GHRR01004971.1~~GHRR01004971.1.p1  ORF type:complete len:284 (+),score=63.50 GHRR01004971.1:120-971(+)